MPDSGQGHHVGRRGPCAVARALAGGQKADDIAMRLGLAWGGQIQDAVNAHLQSLKQFLPRQKGGTLRMAGD